MSSRIFGVASAALALALLASGCAESPSPTTPSVMRGAKLEVMKQLTASLARGGHACALDEDADLLCDVDRKDAPTSVVTFHTGPGGIHMSFLSGFPWKKPDPCADLAKTVNAFNGRARDFYAVCTPEGLTLIALLGVPEAGLTDHDTQAFINWWGPMAAKTAASPPFVSEVK
ncbi:MAG TPA: hypothetical protein VGM56_14825 [Byssovorax sp.]|jgi:hypothetical protein